MKKYDIFLFDADGTLFDFDKAEENAFKLTFKVFGFVYSDALLSRYREISDDLWKQHEKGKLAKNELQTMRFQRLFECFDFSCDGSDFNVKYLNALGQGTYLNEGALKICEEINSYGKKIFIVTNGILVTQVARIGNSLIKGLISDYFVSEHVGYQKPDIRYFDYVLTHIPATDKSKILIIGDSLTADIVGGNNAEIDSCWFNPNKKVNNTEAEPTYEINKLSEVSKFI